MAENPEVLDADVVSYDLDQPENRVGAEVDDSPPPQPKRKSGGRKKRRSRKVEEPAEPVHSPTVAAESVKDEAPAPSTSVEAAPEPDVSNGASNGSSNGAANGTPSSGTDERPRRKVQLKGSLRKLLPNAESVKVYKAELGKQSLVETYRARDIATAGDLEEFIKVHLVPKFGGGDYQVDLVDPRGKVTHTVPFSFAAQPQKSDAEVLSQQITWMQQKLEKVEQNAANQNPLQHLKDFKELFGDKEKGGGGEMTAVLMHLMQQMQGPSATVAELRSELRFLQQRLEESQKKKTVTPVQPLPNLGADKEDSSLKEFMQMLFQQQEAARKEDRERWERERREAEERRREERERYRLEREEAERRERERREEERRFWERQQQEADKRHEMMLQMVQQNSKQQIEVLRAQQETERARFEAKIEKLAELAQGPQTPQEVMAQAKEVIEFADSLTGGNAARKRNADSLFGFLNNLISSSGNVSDAIQRVVDRIRVAEGASPQSDASRQLPAGGGDQQEAASAPSDSGAAGQNLPSEYPVGLKDTLQRANQAEEDRAKIESFLQSLRVLMERGGPVWQKDIRQLLMDAISGRKERALVGVENYLQHFLNDDILQEETCEKIYELFDKHFEIIVEAVKNDAGAAGAAGAAS